MDRVLPPTREICILFQRRRAIQSPHGNLIGVNLTQTNQTRLPPLAVSEPFTTLHVSTTALNAQRTEGALVMATQIVMDHNGDSRHSFDPRDAKALLKAERRFRELTGAGYTAAFRTESGDPVITRSFDPAAEETLFYPRLVGG
jgi:hypothetical protein